MTGLPVPHGSPRREIFCKSLQRASCYGQCLLGALEGEMLFHPWFPAAQTYNVTP